MNNSFHQLVPSAELCQKIPDDAFQESALVHAIPYGVGGDGKLTPALGYEVFPRNMVVCDESLTGKDYKDFDGSHGVVYCYSMIPAPTLQEIMDALYADAEGCCQIVNCFYDKEGWDVVADYECHDGSGYGSSCVQRKDVKNPANAALKIWLGIDV